MRHTAKHHHPEVNRQVIALIARFGNVAETIAADFALRAFNRENSSLSEYWAYIAAKISCIQNKGYIGCLYGNGGCTHKCYEIIRDKNDRRVKESFGHDMRGPDRRTEIIKNPARPVETDHYVERINRRRAN